MEKIIQSLINNWVKGVNTYTHNGSTWLIFTDSKKWVIELTDNKTLWYNYNFFKQIFEFMSLDVVENQYLITKWVEDNIINETKRTNGRGKVFNRRKKVESVIENGVKETNVCNYTDPKTQLRRVKWCNQIDNVIQNGVKHTKIGWHQCNNIDDAIEYGVKETKISPTHTVDGDWLDGDEYLDNIIENGVKETNSWNESIIGDLNQYGCIDTVIKEGIEEIYEVDWDVPNDVIDEVIDTGIISTHDDIYHHKGIVDGVIKNGVKETKTPGDDGDIIGVMNWMLENKTNNVPKMIDDIIKNGIKETEPMDDWVNTVRIVTEVIDEGIKKPTD